MGGDQLEAVKNYGVCGWTRFWVCGWPGRVSFFFYLGGQYVCRGGSNRVRWCWTFATGPRGVGNGDARGRVSSDIRALAGGEDTPTHRIHFNILVIRIIWEYIIYIRIE